MDQRWTKCTHTRGRAAIFQAHFSASHRWIDSLVFNPAGLTLFTDRAARDHSPHTEPSTVEHTRQQPRGCGLDNARTYGDAR